MQCVIQLPEGTFSLFKIRVKNRETKINYLRNFAWRSALHLSIHKCKMNFRWKLLHQVRIQEKWHSFQIINEIFNFIFFAESRIDQGWTKLQALKMRLWLRRRSIRFTSFSRQRIPSWQFAQTLCSDPIWR